MAPGEPDGRAPRWAWPRALAPWLAPVVAAGSLLGLAPGPGVPGIPYPVVILGPVATFLGGSLIVAAAGPVRRPGAARVVMSVGLILAGLTVVLAGGEAVQVVHAGLRGQTLLALGMLGVGVFAGGRLTGDPPPTDPSAIQRSSTRVAARGTGGTHAHGGDHRGPGQATA